jgi:hypothetical protein
MVRSLGHVATMLATLAIILVVAVGGATAGNGNNGTIKIHEETDPNVGTPSNDPKVCSFNVEGFGFDATQQGLIKFAVQGRDGEATADPIITHSVTAVDGAFSTPYTTLRNGHYKATLYDYATGVEKAKSKVFKVTCCSPEGG